MGTNLTLRHVLNNRIVAPPRDRKEQTATKNLDPNGSKDLKLGAWLPASFHIGRTSRSQSTLICPTGVEVQAVSIPRAPFQHPRDTGSERFNMAVRDYHVFLSSNSEPSTVPTHRDISKPLSATNNLRAISMSLVKKLRSNKGISSVDIPSELASEAISEVGGAAFVVSEDEPAAVGKISAAVPTIRLRFSSLLGPSDVPKRTKPLPELVTIT